MADTQKLDAVKTVVATMADDEIAVLRSIVESEVERRATLVPSLRPTQVRDDFRREVADVAKGMVPPPDYETIKVGVEWARWIVRVDRAKQDGWAFEGPFIEEGTVEVPLGRPQLILVKLSNRGKRLYYLQYAVVRMDADGSLHPETNLATDGLKSGWALRLRDKVADRLRELAQGRAKAVTP